MKIIQYCQHVLGIGHLVRTIEILRAFQNDEVILVNGGLKVEFPLPDHIREINLPPLMMDPQFKGLQSVPPGLAVERIKHERQKQLFDLVAREAPDMLMVELFPFGRRAFAFELEPVLLAIREQRLPACAVFCGVRDILVERGRHTKRYEKEVVDRLNRYFSGLLIHSDPNVIRLDRTFSRMAKIAIPVEYTGFVAQRSAAGARETMRAALGLTEADTFMIASAGAGKVGFPFLMAAVAAFNRLRKSNAHVHLTVFTGPFADADDYRQLERSVSDGLTVVRFSPDFINYMAAADVSLSMAGYNTCMNIMTEQIPALVWPFEQNREQRMRAERLQKPGRLEILEDHDLDPDRLAGRIESVVKDGRTPEGTIQLDGARRSAAWVKQHVAAR